MGAFFPRTGIGKSEGAEESIILIKIRLCRVKFRGGFIHI